MSHPSRKGPVWGIRSAVFAAAACGAVSGVVAVRGCAGAGANASGAAPVARAPLYFQAGRDDGTGVLWIVHLPGGGACAVTSSDSGLAQDLATAPVKPHGSRLTLVAFSKPQSRVLVFAAPLALGPPMKVTPAGDDGSRSLCAFRVVTPPAPVALPLAARDPGPKEPVWIYAPDEGGSDRAVMSPAQRPSPFFPARIVAGTLFFLSPTHPPPGSPLLNARGEVVGMIVAGHGDGGWVVMPVSRIKLQLGRVAPAHRCR